MRKIVIILATVLILSSCQKKRKAKEILENAGYTEIEMTGYCVLGCGEDYTYHTGFRAKSPYTGKIVEGCVCEGIFKGASIKVD